MKIKSGITLNEVKEVPLDKREFAFALGCIYQFEFDPNAEDSVPGEWVALPRLWMRIK